MMKLKYLIIIGIVFGLVLLANTYTLEDDTATLVRVEANDIQPRLQKEEIIQKNHERLNAENSIVTNKKTLYVEKEHPTALSSSEEKEAWRSRMGVTIDESAKDNYRAYSDETLLALINEQQDVLAMSVYADRIMDRTGPIDEEYKEFLLLMTKMGSLEGLGRLQILTSVRIKQSFTNPTNDDYFNEKYQQDIAELVGYTLVSAELGNKHFAIGIADNFLTRLNINSQEISMSKVQNLKTALLNEIQTFRYARGLDELTDTRSEGQKASDNYIYGIVKKKFHYNDIWGY